ncbi:MAG: hypothetical protein K0S27_569 [Gammaproteobacteria bacterium]|jgi:hypothetical protein|nr:hypothetical protein [Gammaproteobacteria bacterium]
MRQQILYWWIPLISFSILAYFIQAHVYLHKDVAMTLHTTAAMLTGETYTKNIFEPNPPLIFYLSMPAIILAKVMSISLLSAIRIYFIILATISLNFSYFIIKKLFKNELFLIYMTSYVMIYILFFLPAHQFAQREHFLLVLILPYLFSTAFQLENKKLNPIFSMFIGLMGGIGLAIKPHFLTAFLLVEIYFFFKKKRILASIRVETLCIAGIFLSYTALIFLVYPSYIYNVLPLWMPYYKAIVHPWIEILIYPGFLYCLIILIFYLLIRRSNKYKTTSDIFLAALIGFMFSYLLPRVAWYYHLLPALGMACLLNTFIFSQIAREAMKNYKIKGDIFLLSAMASILYFIPFTLSLHYLITATRYFNSEAPLSHLINFFKHQKNIKFDLFSMTHDSTILEFYTSAHYTGSFAFLIWEYNQVILKYHPNLKASLYEKNIPVMVNRLAQDLVREKPEFVIVDIPSSIDYLGIKINYIEKYSNYKNFNMVWKKYHYLKKIGPYEIYERT